MENAREIQYRRTRFVMGPSFGETGMIYDFRQDRLRLLPQEERAVFQWLDRVAPLGAHIHRAACCSQAPAGPQTGMNNLFSAGPTPLRALASRLLAMAANPSERAAAEQSVQALIEQELLCPVIEPTEHRCVPQHPSGPIADIAVLTKDRPVQLIRQLESTAAVAARAGRQLHVRIFDDGDENRTASLLENLSRDPLVASWLRLRHLGIAAKRAYGALLSSKSGVAPATVAAALHGSAEFCNRTGSNRNCILLSFAGRRFLSFDDDVLWTALKVNDTEVNRHDDRPFLNVPDLNPEARLTSGGDLLSEFDRFLGKCAVRAENQPRASGATLDADIRHPYSGQECVVVRAAYSSLIGNLGHSSAESLLLSLSALDRSSADHSYPLNVFLGGGLRGVAVPTAWQDAWCMTTCFGLDNREFLPPFAPTLRNEDGVFGRLLSDCYPMDCSVHLPSVVRHEPLGRRPFVFDDLVQSAAIRMNDFMLACLPARDWTTSRIPPQDWLACAGRRLVELGSSCWAEAGGEIRRLVRLSLCRKLDAVATIAAGIPDGAKWRPLIHAVQKELERLISTNEVLPFDIAPDKVRDVRTAEVLRYLRTFGQILIAWPALWETAQHLNWNEIQPDQEYHV